jgi:hypothetical protein
MLFVLSDMVGLRLSSSVLFLIVCHQCGKQEVCPDTLNDYYPDSEDAPAQAPATGVDPTV